MSPIILLGLALVASLQGATAFVVTGNGGAPISVDSDGHMKCDITDSVTLGTTDTVLTSAVAEASAAHAISIKTHADNTLKTSNAVLTAAVAEAFATDAISIKTHADNTLKTSNDVLTQVKDDTTGAIALSVKTAGVSLGVTWDADKAIIPLHGGGSATTPTKSALAGTSPRWLANAISMPASTNCVIIGSTDVAITLTIFALGSPTMLVTEGYPTGFQKVVAGAGAFYFPFDCPLTDYAIYLDGYTGTANVYLASIGGTSTLATLV